MALFKKKPKAIVPEPPKMQPYPEAEAVQEAIKEEIPGDESIGMPELPEIPELPELPKGESESEKLEEDKEETEELVKELEEEKERPKTKVKEKLIQELGEKPKLPKKQKPLGRELKLLPRESEKKALFIKIDKFKEILASIELIERKANELEDIIQNIKEVKAKEEQLITSWHQEIEELKSNIAVIEKALSEKFE